MASRNVKPGTRSRGTCRWFNTPGGCRFGDGCKFLHTPSTDPPVPADPNTQQSEITDERATFKQWRYSIPKTPNHHPLPYPRLQKFVQEARELIDADVGTMQETVRLLASEGGLSRLNEIIKCTDNRGRAKEVLSNLVLPTLQIITHHKVVASMILEDRIGTIYNFLYGRQGDRANKVFAFIAKVLAEEPTVCTVSSIEIFLTALSNMIEGNGHALVNHNLKYIAESLLGFVDFKETQNPQFLSRIRKLATRLELGHALPEVSPKRKKTIKAVFNVPLDFPGADSKIGPRHDNDHARITNISILPTSEEISSLRAEYLPPSEASQWHLPSLEGLLDRQFRLLREDTVGQLRDAIRHEIGNAHTSSQQSARVFTYRGVVIEEVTFSRWKGLQVLVSFNQPDRVSKLGKAARKEWWEHTKRMQNGALICMLTENDSVIFCTVGEPEKEKKNASDDSTKQEQSHTLSKDSATAFALLHPLEASEQHIRIFFTLLKQRQPSTRRLIEFPGILLPSFEPTLKALQLMSELNELPFAEHIGPVQQFQTVQPPFYAIKQGFRYNLRDIMTDESDTYYKPGEDFDMASFRSRTHLDRAQADALVHSLDHSLALIQGPPGTGKSFTGVALIKVLLSMKDEADLGPILCVCYTNHALDQLLEHLVDHDVERIVRIGSRSKSERLEDCNLRVVARNVDMTREEKQERYRLGLEIDEEEKQIRSMLFALSDPSSQAVIKDYLETFHPNHYEELFQDLDEEGFQTIKSHEGQEISSWLRKGSRTNSPPRRSQVLYDISIHQMSNAERKTLHHHWIQEIKNSVLVKLNIALESYRLQQSRFDRVRNSVSLRCLQSANVIGVTTTGLARQLDLLRKLSCKILICEEAGEVLESHILTALLPPVQHAILIGDHQQLRPQIQNFDLSRENPRGRQFSLDMSLFERLVGSSESSVPGLPFSALETQRRMHPSISELIRTTLYPQLQDSPHVGGYPRVCGMDKRLFWLDHTHPEEASDQIINTSHSNDFEIEMVLALVTHLTRQAVYAENDIAVLTPYLGQMLKLRRRMAASFEVTMTEGDMQEIEKQGLEPDTLPTGRPAKASLLKSIKISTVDNFQGEEAKIVIISLVRSNTENKCGFLKTSNRINVLLSRAKHGMYIIGNAATSSHVKMWNDVLGLLKAGNNFGTQLRLECPRHPDTPILVSNPDDFVVFSPEGGCDLRCDRRLPCGHACINKCHSLALHNAVPCLEDCPRSIAGCDHICPNCCGDPCVTKCQVVVQCDVTLACGHHRNNLPCWLSQNPSQAICQDMVKRTVPGCDHEVVLPCHIDVDTQPCKAPCGSNLECGHPCPKKCFQCKLRRGGVVISEKHGSCQRVCGRPYTACSHSCVSKCHDGEPCSSCSAACEFACSHSKCYKTCSEPCAPCAEEVCASACPHQQCTMPCASPCNWLPCSKRCEKKLTCGHQCPTICGEICPAPQFCQICANADVQSAIVDYIMMSEYSELDLNEEPCIVPPCGHILTVSSMDGHMEMSEHYSMHGIDCLKVKDSPKPFSMEEVKKCPKCRAPLRNVSRYGRIVRRALIDQSSKRFIMWAREEYLRLMQSLHDQQRLLEDSNGAARLRYKGQEKIELRGPAESQTRDMNKALNNRYRGMRQIRAGLTRHLSKVSIEEQPFKRIWDLVQHVRRRQDSDIDIPWSSDAIQVGESLRVQSLLFRCDLAIMTDFFSLAEASVDFSEAKTQCSDLIVAATNAILPLQQTEGHIFYARYCATERTFAPVDQIAGLVADGKAHLEEAKRLCQENAGSTRSVVGELTEIEKMLRDSTLYAPMRDDEWKNIMAAMRRENIGTGHWYTCENGHPFAVGECGGPMQQTVCPECGSPVGGLHHQAAQGVRRAGDLERRFGGMNLQGEQQ